MKKTITLAAMFVLAMAGSAKAGGQDGAIGVGAEFGLDGETGGVSVNYDGGKFHFGGFLGFIDGGGNNDTDYTLGARFYYHLHSTAMSDFGLGGAIGFFSQDGTGVMMDQRDSRVYIEPGFQIRAFVTSNVALSFTAGITIGIVDAQGTSIGGPSLGGPGNGVSAVTGSAGVHYYFF
jgi:hypothetical protein